MAVHNRLLYSYLRIWFEYTAEQELHIYTVRATSQQSSCGEYLHLFYNFKPGLVNPYAFCENCGNAGFTLVCNN